MANTAAIKFTKQLVAAFNRFPISAETKELYSSKLSRWKMTQPQWDTALDKLIEGHSENLPPLSEIYTALKNAQFTSQQSDSSANATVSFRHNGYEKVILCRNDSGVLVIRDVVIHDVHGAEKHLQAHVGDAVALHIPEAATDVLINYDHPARPEPNEIPTPEEIKAYVDAFNSDIALIAARSALAVPIAPTCSSLPMERRDLHPDPANTGGILRPAIDGAGEGDSGDDEPPF